MLEQVAEGLGGDDPQVDRDPVVGLRPDAVRARGCRRRRSAGGRRGARPAPPAPRRSRSGRCPCRSRPSAAPSRRPRPGRRAGCSRSAAASSSAIGRTVGEQHAGPAPRPARRAAPARPARSPRPSARALSGRGSAAPRPPPSGPRAWRSPSSSKRRRAVFAPRPGTRVTSIRVGGNFAFSFTAAGISPVSSRASIFSASVLPTPGISVALPGGGQLGDRDRAFADRLRRGAVGEHPVFDRAVELVEDPELFEGGGDLGVGHTRQNRRASGWPAGASLYFLKY